MLPVSSLLDFFNITSLHILVTASFVSLPADGTDGKQKGDNSTSTKNQANYDEVYFDSDEEEMVEGNGI